MAPPWSFIYALKATKKEKESVVNGENSEEEEEIYGKVLEAPLRMFGYERAISTYDMKGKPLKKSAMMLTMAPPCSPNHDA